MLRIVEEAERRCLRAIPFWQVIREMGKGVEVHFSFSAIPEGQAMRVKVYDIRPPGRKETEKILHGPGGGEYVLDKSCMHCIITVKEGKGSFKFRNPSREKLIRKQFDAPSFRFVAGGEAPGGGHWDATETHPAWSLEAIEAIVKHQLYAFNLGATIEYDKWDGKSPPKPPEDDKKERGAWFRFLRKWWSK